MNIRKVRFSGPPLLVALLALVLSDVLPGFASAADTRSLNVMTINMWHKDRPHELKVMANFMRNQAGLLPDFILCQEVVFKRGDDDMAQDTAAVLAREMGYQSRGTKRKSDREGVAIISKYAFLFYDELHLKAQTSPLLLGFNRVSVMGEFFVPNIGRVRVVNVHFTNWEFEHRIRGKQMAETMQWIQDRQEKVPAAVTFFGGDFNSKRTWDEMNPVNDVAGAKPITFEDFNGTDPSQGSPGSPRKRIDFIFASMGGRLTFGGEKILFKDRLIDGDSSFYLSDHVAVLHRYYVKGSAPTQLSQAPAVNNHSTAIPAP